MKQGHDRLLQHILARGLARPDAALHWKRATLLNAMYQCGFQEWLRAEVEKFRTQPIIQPAAMSDSAALIRPLFHAGYTAEAQRAVETYKSLRVVVEGMSQHSHSPPLRGWVWVDTVYMVPPGLALAGEEEMAFAEIKAAYTLLRNEHHLLRHIKNTTPLAPEEVYFPQQVWIDGSAWGRGNGWFVAGTVDTLALASRQDPEVERIFRQVCASLLSYQDAGGMWRATIDDPDTVYESSGTLMIAYALRKGVDLGILGPAYQEAAEKALAAVLCHHFDWTTYTVKDQQGGPMMINVPTRATLEDGCTYGQAFLAMLLNLVWG